MRYPASEKAEIIELVEQSHLPAKRTLDKLGIPRATFYRWYDRYCEGGIEALAQSPIAAGSTLESYPRRGPRPDHRSGAGAAGAVVAGMAVRSTDERKYFVSEASLYRLLKAHDLITSPAYVVIIGRGRVQRQDHGDQPALADRLPLPRDHRLGLVLPVDGAGRLLALHRGLDVGADNVRLRATLDQALAASGLDHVTVVQRPRLLSDNGSSYVADDLAMWLKGRHGARARCSVSSPDPR